MDKVRIGIIGCGGIANGKHMPALKKLNDVEMVAFCEGIYRLPRAAQARSGRRSRSDPEPPAFVHHGGRAGSGQARHV